MGASGTALGTVFRAATNHLCRPHLVREASLRELMAVHPPLFKQVIIFAGALRGAQPRRRHGVVHGLRHREAVRGDAAHAGLRHGRHGGGRASGVGLEGRAEGLGLHRCAVHIVCCSIAILHMYSSLRFPHPVIGFVRLLASARQTYSSDSRTDRLRLCDD
jgi:hypothetical protein